MNEVGFEGAGALGRRLIFESTLSKHSQYQYTCAWGWWTSFCQDEGISPLGVSADEAHRFFESKYSKPGTRIKKVRRAVRFVYRVLGMTSPLRASVVQRPNSDGLTPYKPFDGLHEVTRRRYEQFVREYIAWCNCNAVPALPGSPQQVADFLMSLGDRYEWSAVSMARSAVCRYLDIHGDVEMGRHPVVMAASAECRAVRELRQVEELGATSCTGEPGANGPAVSQQALRFHAQWVRWCEAWSIDWESASAAEVLEYLGGISHQKDASTRASRLSRFYVSGSDPFSSEEVFGWKEWHRAAKKDGTLPAWPHVSRAAQVIADLHAAHAALDGPVPAGLTREEAEYVNDDLLVRRSARGLLSQATGWVKFTDWLSLRGIDLDLVTDAHVGAYLRVRAENCLVATVAGDLGKLTAMFDDLGVTPNPARGFRAVTTLEKLRKERREAAAQKPAFRKVHFDALVAHFSEVIAGDYPELEKMRALRVLALFGIMFDGLLRCAEVVAVRWSDIKALPGGGAALNVPFTKTTKDGSGAPTYISPGTMEYLQQFRTLRHRLAREKLDDATIFQCTDHSIMRWITEACEAAGLNDGFTSHSLRIGMTCELAVAGFGLPLIMLAGRWKKPDMVVLYIRNLKLDDSAVALLGRMWANGRARASDEMAGIDVLSTYHHVARTLY